MRMWLVGGAALVILTLSAGMAQEQNTEEPGLMEQVGATTAGVIGTTAGATVGPLGAAVGGLVGQRVGKGAVGLVKRMFVGEPKAAAPPVAPPTDAMMASADASAVAPLIQVPDPPLLDVPPADEASQVSEAPPELLPER